MCCTGRIVPESINFIWNDMKYARIAVVIAATMMVFSASAQNRYLGNLTVNPYLPPAPIQPAGTFTNPYGNSSNSPQLVGAD